MTREAMRAKTLERQIETLKERLEWRRQLAEKKADAAAKHGVNISEEEFRAIRYTVTDEQSEAFFALSIARDELEDVKRRIDKLTQSAEKANAAVAKQQQRIKEAEAERAAAQEIEKWEQDGIKIIQVTSKMIAGETPQGKRFRIRDNHGFTERSRHCCTLTIEGETIFTSGEFSRAYAVVKAS